MSDCVEYTGAKNKKGYGWRRYKGYPTLAHRAAWMEEKGEIPEDMTIHHICYNPPCINVEHLMIMTRAENTADRTYTKKTHCPSGHEFTQENTRISRSIKKKTGKEYWFQQCKICCRDAQERWLNKNGRGREGVLL